MSEKKEMTHTDFIDKLKDLYDNMPKGMHLVFLVAYNNEKGELKDLSAIKGDTEHVLSTVINFFQCNPHIEKEYTAIRIGMAVEKLMEEREDKMSNPINEKPI